MTATKKSVAKLKKDLDTVFSLYIRYRDSSKQANGDWYGNCITCNKRIPFKIYDMTRGKYVINGQCHAGHFMSRRYMSTRYDEENVNLQCTGCNTFNSGEQYKYSINVDLKYGDGTAAKLAQLARQTRKFKSFELEELIDYYKGLVKEYEAM